MYNCMILGSGRSGTSLVAGILNNGKYFMGTDLIPPSPANPKGFFESAFINLDINEASLRRLNPDVERGHWWLTAVPTSSLITSDVEIRRKIRKMTSRKYYCYKDPRFCYTLHLWNPYLINTRFVCVFRHPHSTIKSMIKEKKTARYLRTLEFNNVTAETVWCSMYEWVLNIHSKKGEWLYVSYEYMLCKEGINRLSCFLDAPVDRVFPDVKLNRSSARTPEAYTLSERTMNLYYELCNRANIA